MMPRTILFVTQSGINRSQKRRRSIPNIGDTDMPGSPMPSASPVRNASRRVLFLWDSFLRLRLRRRRRRRLAAAIFCFIQPFALRDVPSGACLTVGLLRG